MMAAWFKCFPSDFLNGVADLSPNELAVYTVCLMRMYDEDGPIPDDPEKIARRCNMRLPACQKALDGLCADPDKLVRQDGRLINPRAQKEIEKRRETNTKQSQNARKRPKKPNKNKGTPQRSHSQNDADGLPTRSQIPEAREECSDNQRLSGDKSPRVVGGSEFDDATKIVFDLGVALLKDAGTPEREARSIIGMWRKTLSDEDLLPIIAQARPKSEPVSYIQAAVKNLKMEKRFGKGYRPMPAGGG